MLASLPSTPRAQRRRLALATTAIAGASVAGIVAIAAAAEGDRIAALDAGETMPGGEATTPGSTNNRDAFSRFSHNIGLAGESRFKLGNAIFRKLWVSAPASTKSSDGLGPLYNARGCQNCHLKDGRGHPPAANFPDELSVSMFLRLSVPPRTEEQRRAIAEHKMSGVPEPTYGGQLQNFAIQGHAAEGQMITTFADVPVPLADGTIVTLRKPTYTISDLGYGPLASDVMTSPRVAPQMIGLGLLEAIPEAEIRAAADPDDKDGDGISGRARETWSIEMGRTALGRFGWKAGNPSIRQQSADAFNGDMGLSTSLFPGSSGDCTASQKVCLDAPNGNSPSPTDHEVSDDLLALVTFYAQNLAVPLRRGADDSQVLAGKAVFASIGCASCHTPRHTTGDVPDQPHLSRQTIWPYTDLLLHDMGDGLADNRPEGEATGSEWRTPPLWGVGLTEVVSGHTFLLHDGRARNVGEAILWHGGEGKASRDAYAALGKAEREALIAFVNSL